MNIFWENIQRYPRFLISSVLGLIIILFGDIIKQSQKGFINQIIFVFFIVCLVGFLIISFSLIFNL
jgi:hypothetical protein